MQFLAGSGINNGGLDAEEGERCTAWFSWRAKGQRCDDMATCLCLPIGLLLDVPFQGRYINDCTFVISNHFSVPFPDFRCDGFTNRAKNSQ